MIPVFRPRYNKSRVLRDLESILDSGWTGLGPKTAEFEQRIAEFVGAPYSVAVNSCTAALHLAVESLNLPRGSKVAVPDITFASSAAAVLHAGLTPRLVPVEEESLCLDLDALELAAEQEKDIRAVIVVHYSGNACDMRRLCSVCESRGLPLIEDCAHALGSSYRGRHLGTFGALGCYSFHVVKNLPIGDGGAIVGLGAHRERLLRLRWMGIDRSTFERTSTQRYSYSYDIAELGYKYHMNDIAAVIGLANMEDLLASNQARRSIYERYVRALPELEIHTVRPGVESSHHLVSCAIDDRDGFIDFMASKGVQIGVHYKPLSMFRLFRSHADGATAERSRRTFERLATLPCYPDLGPEDQETVITEIKHFLKRNVIVPHEAKPCAAKPTLPI